MRTSTIGKRLDRLERSWPQATAPADPPFDPARLTAEEWVELKDLARALQAVTDPPSEGCWPDLGVALNRLPLKKLRRLRKLLLKGKGMSVPGVTDR